MLRCPEWTGGRIVFLQTAGWEALRLPVKPVALDPVPSLRGRPLDALRAVAANPGGLHLKAHPSTMPLLLELGLVRVRERGEPA